MHPVPVDLLRHACQIFLDHAYPGGPDAIPSELCPEEMFLDQAGSETALRTSDSAVGRVRRLEGARPGYSVRLGSAKFPYLRLTFQFFDRDGEPLWLCGVDTHDSWRHPDHPDADAWRAIQAANRELKAQVEHAWEQAGIFTQNRLLRLELEPAIS